MFHQHRLRQDPQLNISSWGEVTNTTQSNVNSTSNGMAESSEISVGMVIIGSCLFMLVCYLAKPEIPRAELRRGAALRERARERRLRQQRIDNLKDPEVRQKVIETSLIVKRVIAADEEGHLSLGDVGESDDASGDCGGSVSLHSEGAQDDTSCCAICLEPFRVKDVVAWSKHAVDPVNGGMVECSHVFHHECILQWLEHTGHDDCPSCRSIILQVNEDEANSDYVESSEECCPIDDSDSTTGTIDQFIKDGMVILRRSHLPKSGVTMTV